MQSTGITYQDVFQGQPITIEVMAILRKKVYRCTFADGQFFFLTKVESSASGDFWTSLPQGKQELAEAIGPLIDNHIAPAPKPKALKVPLPKPPTLF
jgi:hypothetical protein